MCLCGTVFCWYPWRRYERSIARAPGADENLVILDEALSSEDYAMAINKDNTELLDKVNAAIAELDEEGTLDEIVNKYIPAE